MLSSSRRIHRSGDFDRAMRRGQRIRKGALVAHVATDVPPTRCGFIVSKAVGNSVVRHRVTRQLRHLCHDRYDALPLDVIVVLRALPQASEVSFARLRSDFERIVDQIAGSVAPREVMRDARSSDE